mmetsp:Transcript_42706/g.129735  ORF Transcript_42706/g.129735 Transcript_42706/m.129735 type:complete len:220 (-) Transcript_42706:1601-2260(-)
MCLAILSTVPPMIRSSLEYATYLPSSSGSSVGSFHNAALTIAPSRKRRSRALSSPHNATNADVDGPSDAGGPRSTRRREASGSMRSPRTRRRDRREDDAEDSGEEPAEERGDRIASSWAHSGISPSEPRTGTHRLPFPPPPPLASTISPSPAVSGRTAPIRSPRAALSILTAPRDRDSYRPRSSASSPHKSDPCSPSSSPPVGKATLLRSRRTYASYLR